MAFVPSDGTLVCGDCVMQSMGRCVHTGLGATAAMRHAIYAPQDKLYSFNITGNGLRTFSDVAEEYILEHSDKTFPTLEFYKTISTENCDE